MMFGRYWRKRCEELERANLEFRDAYAKIMEENKILKRALEEDRAQLTAVSAKLADAEQRAATATRGLNTLQDTVNQIRELINGR
jgi:hypothetical protein